LNTTEDIERSKLNTGKQEIGDLPGFEMSAGQITGHAGASRSVTVVKLGGVNRPPVGFCRSWKVENEIPKNLEMPGREALRFQ